MSPQAGWILEHEIAPRIGAAVPRTVLSVGAEDSEELVYDTITMAARMIDRVERQGKLDKITPGNIAFYCIQHAKSGRRACGSSAVDVYGSMTQLNGCSCTHSLNEVVSQSECGDEIFELGDVLSRDNEDPGTIAARSLDWATFRESLSRLELLLVEALVNGVSVRKAAKIAKVSYDSMQNYRSKIAQKIIELMGADILQEIAMEPQWRIGLDCEHESAAYRFERRG